MIDSVGYYMTRDGRVVSITRLLENQLIAEGHLMTAGVKKSFHFWNLDGSFNRLKETDYDIVRFMYNLTNNESSDDGTY